jgi:hypothetical protein
LSDATVFSWESPQNQKNKARHVPAVRIPEGPPGTVARRLWRSQNWAEESPSEGDDAIYLSLTVPNNIDELVFDPTPPNGLGRSGAVARGPHRAAHRDPDVRHDLPGPAVHRGLDG